MSTSSSRGANAAAARSRPSSTTESLRRYFAYLQTRGFGKASISRKAASVHAYVRFLRRHGVVSRDVAARLHTARGPKKLPRVPRRDDAVAMLDARRRRPIPTIRARSRDVALLELLYGAGPARQRMLRPRRRVRRPAPGDRHRARQGLEGPPAAARRPGVRRGRRLSPERPAGAAPGSRPTGPLRQRPGQPHDAPGRAAGAGPLPARRRPDPPSSLRCGMPTRPISSREEPISGLFKSCSDTPMWVRRRSTLM